MIKRLFCRLGVHRRSHYIGIDHARPNEASVVIGWYCRWCQIFMIENSQWMTDLGDSHVIAKVSR